MTVEIIRNPDGSVTVTVGGWVGPDPERIEAAAKAHEAFHNLHCDDPNCMYWVTHVKFATEVLAAAYPVGPVLTLTADEWADFEKQIAAKAPGGSGRLTDTTDPTGKPETPNLMAALRASLDEAKVQREARNDPAGLVRAVLSVGDPERAVVISRPTLTAAADEIDSLRAQLAAVTERAEQLRMALTDLCNRVQRDNYGREAVDVFDIREALREPGEPR